MLETGRSILLQTFSDLEWIIIDDGSEEDIGSLVKSFNDARIRYYRLEHTGKFTFLHNYGIDKAKGEYIIMPDSDDLLVTDALEKLHKILLENKDLDFVISDVEIFNLKQILFPSIYSNEHRADDGTTYFLRLIRDKLFVIFTSGFLFRRSCLDKCGMFNEELKYGDKDMLTRITAHCKGKITDEVLVRIRKHDQNVTSVTGKGSPAEESFREELVTLSYLFEKKFIASKLFNQLSAVYNFKLGDYYFSQKSFLEAKQAYRQGLSFNKWDLKRRLKSIIS